MVARLTGRAEAGAGPARGLYDPALDKWSEADQEHEMLWVAGGSATTLEQLDAPYPDIDTMDISLDSTRWIGGNEQLAMFDTSHQSGFFDGAPRTATITTREYMFDGAQRARLRGFRPLVRGGASNTEITGRVGFRNNPIMDPNYTDPSTPQWLASGRKRMASW